MKKTFLFLIFVISCTYFIGCDSIDRHEVRTEASTEIIIEAPTEELTEEPTESVTEVPTESVTEVETISYDQKIADLDSEYASRRQPIDQKYNSDLSTWTAQHTSLERELTMLEAEYTYTEKSYNSDISYLQSLAYQKAAAAGQEAYDKTYSKYTSAAGGFGSSVAEPAAKQAYNTAYQNVMDSYDIQIASLKREKTQALEAIQWKIDLQRQIISDSESQKNSLLTTYNQTVASLDAWYSTQKAAIDTAYGK